LKVEFSTFPRAAAAQSGERQWLTVEEITSRYFTKHQIKPGWIKDIDTQKDGKQFSLARYIDKTNNSVQSSKATINGMYGLILDFDNKGPEPYITHSVIQEKLEGYYYILHTTHSHMREVKGETARDKYRAVLFFDKAVNVEDFVYIANHFMQIFPGWREHIDENCANVSWRWYLPSCAAINRDSAFIAVNQGKMVDTSSILKQRAAEEQVGKESSDDYIDNNNGHKCPPATCEEIYTEKDIVVKQENQESANKNFPSRKAYSNYFTDNRDILLLRQRVLNVLHDPKMNPANFEYNDWFKIGSSIKGAGLPFDVFDDWCSLDPSKYDGVAKTKKKWDSMTRTAGAGTLFYIASKQGVKYYKGYKEVKVRTTKGSLQAAQVLDYADDDAANKVFSQEEADKMNLAPTPTEKFFPDHLIDLAPDPVGMWVQHVIDSSTLPNRTMAFSSTFATLAGLYHHRIIGPRHRCTPNIYAVGLAGSGQGKGHGVKCAKALYRALGLYDMHVREVVPGSGHGVANALINSDRSVVYLWEEFENDFLAPMSERNIPSFIRDIQSKFLNWYTNADDSVSAFGDNQANANSPKIWYPHISIYGTAQPELFYKNYVSPTGSKGFLARMLPFIYNLRSIPARDRPLREIEDFSPELLRFCKNILNIPKGISAFNNEFKPRLIPFESESVNKIAQDFETHMNHMGNQEYRNNNFVVASIYHRIPQHAMKVALIAHEGATISERVYKWAQEVAINCAENIIINAIHDSGRNEYESELNQIYKVIAKNKFINRTELSKKTRSIPTRRRNDYLAQLKSEGAIIEIDQRSGGGPIKAYAALQRKY
jgi:hypothetical protein